MKEERGIWYQHK